MQIALKLFDSLIQGIREEMVYIEKSNILDHYCREHALSKIFQESVLRYIALRNFYKQNSNTLVRFDTEVDGSIDLILEHDSSKVAFEFKRWQTKEAGEIKGKDYKKLCRFKRLHEKHSGYSVIFTNNHYEKAKAEFEQEFKKDLAPHYALRECEVIPSRKHTICLYLAEPK